jgi:hypothetical protein
LSLAVVIQVACGSDTEGEEEKDEDKPRNHLIEAGTEWHEIPPSFGIVVRKAVSDVRLYQMGFRLSMDCRKKLLFIVQLP